MNETEKNYSNIFKLVEDIKTSINNGLSYKQTFLYKNIELTLNQASKEYLNYFNLVFPEIGFTTSNFNQIQQKISANAECSSYQEWNNYPAIILETLNNKPISNIKLQSSAYDQLQLNFEISCDTQDLADAIEFILNYHYKPDPHKTKLAAKILQILKNKNIDIFEDIDCCYKDKFWDIRVHGDIHFTYLFDAGKGRRYLNFRGFYLAKDFEKFKKYLCNLFKNCVDLDSAPVRLGTDGISYELEVKFKKNKAGKILADNGFTVNFTNTGLFSIVYEDEDKLLKSYAIKFIELLLDDQALALGQLPFNQQEFDEYIKKCKDKNEGMPKINLGLINEFGFPINVLKNQVLNLMEKFKYGSGKSDFKEIDAGKNNFYKMLDANCSNLIFNIFSAEAIEHIKQVVPNIIFIACGLEHGLASVSKQKLVKEYSLRINKESSDKSLKEEDYSQIMALLNSHSNQEFKKLENSINKCYHQADFFINYDSDKNSKLSEHKLKQQLKRFFNLIHGYPYLTPTKDEFMMHMAFASALRSADLSRQVGVVIANSRGDIIATGANDIPKSGGGLYWSNVHPENGTIYDSALGRDYMRGFDSNVVERAEIIYELADSLQLSTDQIQILKDSSIKHLTEYGRVVHAEMEALMACARNCVSTLKSTLYCTTFPCHNCAKHIIAAGIKRVVYIEPYSKSKALPFHLDSVIDEEENPISKNLNGELLALSENKMEKFGYDAEDNLSKVLFESFIGVGPRLFRQLFKMKADSRKDSSGKVLQAWVPKLIQIN